MGLAWGLVIIRGNFTILGLDRREFGMPRHDDGGAGIWICCLVRYLLLVDIFCHGDLAISKVPYDLIISFILDRADYRKAIRRVC